ncbi:hypothetical protein ACS0TY_020511 [Phlomoides rotata]
MSRSFRIGELLFDHEIEKTACRLKKEKKLKRPVSSLSSPRKDLVLDSTNSSSESDSEEEIKMTQ